MKKTSKPTRSYRHARPKPSLSCILIGLTLRQFRESRSLTQETVAELSGCHASYLSIIENGKSQLSIRTLEELCQALALSPAQLFNLVKELEAHYLNSELVRSGQVEPYNPLTAQRWFQEYVKNEPLI